MVRRGPCLNDRLRRFLHYQAGQHPLATSLLRSQRDRALSLHPDAEATLVDAAMPGGCCSLPGPNTIKR